MDSFDAKREPMRAIRDLISACETVFGPHEYEQTILDRAREAFTVLRALHGDTRPGDAIADAAMREPDFATLQMTAGALYCVAKLLPDGEDHIVTFTGAYQDFGCPPIREILDMANTALEGVAKAALAKTAVN